MSDTTFTNTPAAKPQVDRSRPKTALIYGAAAALAGLLLYLGGVSLLDIFRHPMWSAKRIVGGILDEFWPLLTSLLSGAALVAPVWAFMGWRSQK